MPLLSPKARILLKLFTPQRRKPDPRHALSEADRDLSGRTIVFTGGTDGMGRAAVAMLHAMGADVIVLGRDPDKAADLMARARRARRPGAPSASSSAISRRCGASATARTASSPRRSGSTFS